MTYRVWFRNGSAIMVESDSHLEAAQEAIELAVLQNAPAPRTDDDDYHRYRESIKVRKTECVTDGSVKNWR